MLFVFLLEKLVKYDFCILKHLPDMIIATHSVTLLTKNYNMYIKVFDPDLQQTLTFAVPAFTDDECRHLLLLLF